MVAASKWISWGVGKGAEKAGELISYGSLKLRDKLRPVGQPKPVDPRVQTGMEYARKATNVAVSVSGYIGQFVYVFVCVCVCVNCEKACVCACVHACVCYLWESVCVCVCYLWESMCVC